MKRNISHGPKTLSSPTGKVEMDEYVPGMVSSTVIKPRLMRIICDKSPVHVKETFSLKHGTYKLIFINENKLENHAIDHKDCNDKENNSSDYLPLWHPKDTHNRTAPKIKKLIDNTQDYVPIFNRKKEGSMPIIS